MPAYSLSAYHPTGDGVADDGPALQRAIDAFPAEGGFLYIPKGEYNLDTTVTLDKPVGMWGDPGSVLLRKEIGSLFIAMANNVSFNALTFRGEAVDSRQVLSDQVPTADRQGLHSWRWIDCQFDQIGLELSDPARYDLNGDQSTSGSDVVTNVRIERCYFHDAHISKTLYLGGVENVVVRANWFNNCGLDTSSGDAIKVSDGSQYITITENRIENPARDGIDVYDSNRVDFSHNVVSGAGVQGYEAKWAGPSNHNDIIYHRCYGNTIESCGNDGIAMSVKESSVEGNTVIGCTNGIRINNANGNLGDTENLESTHTIVSGNQCFANSSVGIRPTGDHCLIMGNVVSGSNYGIYIPGNDNLVVGNVVRANTAGNITDAGTGNTLTNNQQSV